VNRQNDATVPLEAQQRNKDVKDMENRLDQLETMMKNQDETLRRLTDLMSNLAGGGAKDDK
jgi:hypothetical protein